MSRAEERALEAYPAFMTTLIPADDEHPLIEQDCNKFTRKAYLKGYHQAEKDLELTWDDVSVLNCLLNEVAHDFKKGLHEDKDYIGYCKEVLKRFKDYKERKEE